MRQVPVEFNSDFFKSIHKISKKISSKILIKQFEEKLKIVQQSDGAEIIINMSAPMEMFNYNRELGLGDFPTFINVFNAMGENPKIVVNEKEIGDNKYEAVSVTLTGEDGTSAIIAASQPSVCKSGKSPLPEVSEDHFYFEITEEELKNIKLLTGALVTETAEFGTALAIKKDKEDSSVSLRFKGDSALGNGFTKHYDVPNTEEVDIKLMFDPLFFMWLPNNDYKIRVADYKDNSKTPHIMATAIETDGDEKEICTQNFIAGRLKTPFIN
jgi:hypothetical protein